MADRLSVDLDGLESFSSDLGIIRATMADAGSWMRQFDGELGGDDVDGAVNHFESHWSDGRGRVDKNCENFVKLVNQAVENIRKADEDLEKQLVQSGETA
ncbi:hypothetical protein [Kineosporia babensis]|uniref:Uncharacterized protein n=1 Tax=Kineosporia babensis TaxID=499548 RepID=A0A9X1NHT9_9ACTN|nr:hypothetical protein [Kineosporia babensis]MCD5314393.1 hypothetical protein [Kineosporia babensis]